MWITPVILLLFQSATAQEEMTIWLRRVANKEVKWHWRPFEKVVAPINRRQFLPLEAVTFADAIKPAGSTSGAFGK